MRNPVAPSVGGSPDTPALQVSTAAEYGWLDDARTLAHSYIEPMALRLIRDLAKVDAGSCPSRVFDAGCGNGSLLASLAHEDYILGGCDASQSGVEIVRRRMQGRARIEQLSVYDDMAAKVGSDWDTVVSTEVIEHLYAPREFLARAGALLRPGGHLILSTPYHGYLKNLVLAATGRMDGHFTVLWDGGHIKFWSRKSLAAVLREAGFGELEFHGAGRFPWLWKSMFFVAKKL